MSNLTTNLNYLTPSNFKLTLDHEYYHNVEYFVHSFMHPSATVSAAQGYSSSRAAIPTPGDHLVFGELQITLIVDEDMKGYMELFDWLTQQVNTKEKLVKDGGSRPSYTDMTLSVLSSKNNKTKRIKYKDCFVTDIGSLQFETANQEGYMTFTTTFKFTEFVID